MTLSAMLFAGAAFICLLGIALIEGERSRLRGWKGWTGAIVFRDEHHLPWRERFGTLQVAPHHDEDGPVPAYTEIYFPLPGGRVLAWWFTGRAVGR